MMQHYEVEDTILRSTAELTLTRSDKVSLEIKKGTLTLPVKVEDKREGYIFLGEGKLLIDAIVETEKGAVGKPVQRELGELFLMLGNTEETSKHLEKANEDDLRRRNLTEKILFSQAQDLLTKFTEKRAPHGSEHLRQPEGSIFAFPNGESNLDLLLLNGPRLIYTTKDMSFICDGDKSVLNTPRQVFLSAQGASLAFGRPHMHHGCCQ
jgi:hypothetical protein